MNTFPLVRTLLASVVAITTVTANSQTHPAALSSSISPVAATSRVDTQYGKLPLSFEPNLGQTSKQVQWLAHGPAYTLFLAGHDAVLELNKATPVRRGDTKMPTVESVALRMNLLNTKDAGQSSGEQLQPGKSNYFTGRDSSKWQREVPMYGQVRLESVYPGVDLLYYGHQGQLEYDFVIAAGADPSMIRMSFDGATPMLAANGDLTLPVDRAKVNGSKTEISFQKPVVYQVKDGVRQPVDGSFSIADNHEVSFHLGAYDHSRELVIDPTLLFVGTLGTGSVGTMPNGMAVDGAGEIILTGYTRDLDFPVTSGGLQTECQTYSAAATGNLTRCGPNDGAQTSAFVTKISADGKSLVYSTYLHGGGGQESGESVVADAAGDAYILGATSSNDFPITANAIENLCAPYYSNNAEGSFCDSTSINGYGDGGQSLFIVKLNPAGSSILYGTFFGGTAAMYPVQLALDSSSNIYFVGFTITEPSTYYYPSTASVPFPVTTGAYQAYGVGVGTATLSKLSANGQTLMYSTLLGSLNGSFFAATEPYALAVGPNGMAYVGGQTLAADFPTTSGVVKPSCVPTPSTPGNCISYTAFLSAFDTTKTGSASLAYSTYIGGTEVAGGNSVPQEVQGLVADSSNNIYVTGYSTAIDFPTTKGAYQTTCTVFANSGTCNPVGFVQKINPTGTAYIWSTLYGADNVEGVNGNPEAIALDATDRVYIYGQSHYGGGDFVNPVEACNCGGDKIFIATFSADGSQLLFGTHLANLANTTSESDEPVAGGGLALDATGNMYFVGYGADNGTFVSSSGTYSDTAVGAGYRAYFGKISPVLAADTTTLTIAPATTTTGQTVTFTATVVGTSQTTPAPTGTVTLTNTAVTPAATIGTITLGSNGSGTYTSDSLAAGTYTVTATYGADSVYDVSTSSAQTLTITSPASATVTLTAPASAYVGASVTFSTTVSGSGGTPTGTVTFKDGAATLSTVTLASGTASFSTNTLAIGAHSISVSYGGNSVFGPAASAAQTVTINPYTATVGLTASPTTALPNTAVTLSASVAASAGSAVPTGSVSFMDGTTLLSKVTLASGKAGLTTSSLAVGSHSITAVYSGDGNFATVTSSAQTVVIRTAAATTTSLGTSNASSDEGAAVTLTATISSSASGSITGTVTFYDGTTSLGTGTVTNGAATFTSSSLSVGTHSITAAFGGDTLYLASTSTALSEVVVAPSIAFAANPTTVTIAKGAGGTFVFTATPTGGYTGGVSFACGTLPADASCSFAPASLTFTSASGAQTSTLTFSTKLATSAASTHGPGRSYAPEVFAGLLLFPLGFRKRLRKLVAQYHLGGGLMLLLFIVTATCGLLAVTGCGSSGAPSTPAGTYNVPVTVTAGSATSTISLTVVVQ